MQRAAAWSRTSAARRAPFARVRVNPFRGKSPPEWGDLPRRELVCFDAEIRRSRPTAASVHRAAAAGAREGGGPPSPLWEPSWPCLCPYRAISHPYVSLLDCAMIGQFWTSPLWTPRPLDRRGRRIHSDCP